MGQKVNPIGLRLGINRTADSRWYADDDFADLLHQDIQMRNHIMKQLKPAGISRVIIERPAKKPRISIYAARPGLIIGKKGSDIEDLKKQLQKMSKEDVSLNIVEIRKPEIDAKLIADNVAQQLERRVSFRRAMKRVMQSAMRTGAEGIRLAVSGRLGGADIARVEWYREGRVPLHTLRADIDYGFSEAMTTYGVIGVKCWVFKGEIMEHDPMAHERRMIEVQRPGGGPGRSGGPGRGGANRPGSEKAVPTKTVKAKPKATATKTTDAATKKSEAAASSVTTPSSAS